MNRSRSAFISRCRMLTAFIAAFSFTNAFSELPSELPGEEITQEYNWNAVVDSGMGPAQREDSFSLDIHAPPKWLVKAMRTWDAPPMFEQQASDETYVPLGKGAIFVPRLTPFLNEPDIEIIDGKGVKIDNGEPGRTYPLEPGKYFVVLGSGSHHQRIVRNVDVQEGQTTPVVPDWSALTIDIVDTNVNQFRGEYELVRIDEFEPFGRGFGANPDLGEVAKTWVLKPGVYKILGVGEGYNTLRNFVTVRLLPGELTKFTLVERPSDLQILGGGTVDVTKGTVIASNWKYGADVGGSLEFNGDIDHSSATEEANKNSTTFSLSSNVWLTFNEGPFEWTTKVRLDELFNFSDFDVPNLFTDRDEFKTTSLFLWRFVPWFGPFGRLEIKTNFLPDRIKLEDKKYTCVLDSAMYIGPRSFDSSSTFELTPAFSPFIFDAGVGANADLISQAYFESKVRLGFGSSFSSFPDRFQPENAGTARIDTTDPVQAEKDYSRLQQSLVFSRLYKTMMFELGPQLALTAMVRIGRWATADMEVNIFAPVAPEQRFTRPDVDLNSTLSWRLARSITLDYTYSYLLKQPESESARVNKSKHGVQLRVQFSSR